MVDSKIEDYRDGRARKPLRGESVIFWFDESAKNRLGRLFTKEDEMEPINGVTLEKYADLCALMAETNGDESKEIAIAQTNGVSADAWRAAKKGWTAVMSDPSDMGKTALQFLPLYQAAQARMRGGQEPCTLEDYSRLYAEVYFGGGGDPSNKDAVTAIVEKAGYTYPKWLEFNVYWAEVVGEEKSPRFNIEKARAFGRIVKEFSEKRNSGV